jgi:hypothetical protein
MALARRESSNNTRALVVRALTFLESTSMFKKLIPVIALALIAGPAFAAQSTEAPKESKEAPAATSTPAKSTHKKHHKKATKEKKSSSESSSAPPK